MEKTKRKIILSKKGLDSSFCNQPIFITGTTEELPFIPILDPEAPDGHTYKEFFKNITIQNKNITIQKKYFEENAKITWNYGKTGFKECNDEEVNNFKCHIDPQLEDYFSNGAQFLASFGQSEGAQSHLANCGVGVGDIFLFFGRYYNQKREQNIIFGYMEIGDIITFAENKLVYRTTKLDKNEDGYELIGKFENKKFINQGNENIEEKYPFLNNQPHWLRLKKDFQKNYKKDVIYIAKENEFGIFNYNESLILTDTEKSNKLKTEWNIKKLSESKVDKLQPLKRCVYLEKGKGRLVKGYCQELVFENKQVLNWALGLIEENLKNNEKVSK